MINQTEKSARQTQEELEIAEAVKEYLANGGKITRCEPNARTENLAVGQWGRKNAKKKIENPSE